MDIIYILSTSRSGSTIIEHSLGAFNGIVNVGELRRLQSFYNEDRRTIQDSSNQIGCTCGEKVKQCVFWNKVEEKSGLNFSSVKLTSQMNLFNRIFFRICYLITGPDLLKKISNMYKPFKNELTAADNVFRIYQAIKEITQCRCIIDSSKMLHQILMLKTLSPRSVGMLCVVRDGRAVSHSMIRGERKNSFKQGKYADDTNSEAGQKHLYRAAVLSWLRSTLEFLLFYARIPRKERLLVQYEDFCQHPAEVTSNIMSQFIQCDTETRTTISKPSHTIGGSPSRFKPDFAQIVQDEKWKDSYSKDQRRIFMIYAGLLNRALGYEE